MTTSNYSQEEIQEIIDHAEEILKEFINSPVKSTEKIGWKKAEWQNNFRDRLNGNPKERYHIMLYQTMTRSMDEEKGKIFTAAFIYELQNRDSIKPGPYTNPLNLFKFALVIRKKHEGLAGKAIGQYLDTTPLQDICCWFSGVEKNRAENLCYLSELAVERLTTERVVAEKIMEETIKENFQFISPDKLFLAETGSITGRLQRYGDNALNYILTEIKEQQPETFNKLASELYLKLSAFRGCADWYKKEKYEKVEIERLKLLEDIVEKTPILASAYQESIQQYRSEVEQKKSEEEKKFLEKYGRCMEKIQRLELCDLSAEDIVDWVNGISFNTLSYWWQLRNLKIFPAEVLIKSAGKVDINQINLYVSNLASNLEFLKFEEKAVDLENAWNKKEKQIELQLPKVFRGNEEMVYDALIHRFRANTETPEAYKVLLEELQQALKEIKRAISYNSEEEKNSMHLLLRGMAEKIEKRLSEVSPAYESMKSRAEKNKRQKDLLSTQREYLLEGIKRQISYLKEIYQIGTGLDLADTESKTSSGGCSIASVSMGMRLMPELRQEMSLHLADEGIIELEVEESFESIKKRTAVINWVVPHEIAHLAATATDVLLRIFTKEDTAEIKELTRSWPAKRNIDKLILAVAKEVVMDSVGYRLLKEYGSADPFDQSKAQRITAATTAFNATMDILEELAVKNAKKVFHYSVTALRAIASGQVLVCEVQDAGEKQKGLEKIQSLYALFERLNQNFISQTQKEKIISLFKEYFKKAQTVPLVPKWDKEE